jgi:hypothetical protein
MSHHTATLQYTFEKTASALDFAYTAMARLYWLDDNYVQSIFTPGLRLVSMTWLSVASTGNSSLSLMSHFGWSTQPVNLWLEMPMRSPLMLLLMLHYRNFHLLALPLMLDGALSDLSSSGGAVSSRFWSLGSR